MSGIGIILLQLEPLPGHASLSGARAAVLALPWALTHPVRDAVVLGAALGMVRRLAGF